MCLKSWKLKGQLEERDLMLAARSRELAVHLDRERRTVAELEELNRSQVIGNLVEATPERP